MANPKDPRELYELTDQLNEEQCREFAKRCALDVADMISPWSEFEGHVGRLKNVVEYLRGDYKTYSGWWPAGAEETSREHARDMLAALVWREEAENRTEPLAEAHAINATFFACQSRLCPGDVRIVARSSARAMDDWPAMTKQLEYLREIVG